MGPAQKLCLAGLASVLTAALAGCGTPGAPQPPSLNLADRVADLSAVRAGNEVTLTWTCPKKNTDKILLKGEIAVRVCRREGAGTCEIAGAGTQAAPGAKASYVDALPPALAAGSGRALHYFVELTNRNGRSAGLSNGASVLAGAAPGPVSGLRATVRKEGVELHWEADASQAEVRLERKLISPAKRERPSERGPMAPEPEAAEQNLLVEHGAQTGGALDKSVRFDESYEYRAQQVIRLTVDNQPLELAGEWSAPVRVDVLDVFPPEAPRGLVAVATTPPEGAQGAEAHSSIDLSWEPDTEADLAGYIVYRREEGGEWQRISGEQPVAGPAFHDANVAPGHAYFYAVSAVDQKGHESGRSGEAKEKAPDE